MKIQCACGTKYAFDVTPEMVRSPIKFVCQGCGHDNSDVINQLIRQEFASTAPSGPAIAPPPEVAPPPVGRTGAATPGRVTSATGSASAPAPAAAPPPGPPRVATLRVSAAHAPAPVSSGTSAPASGASSATAGAPPVGAPQSCVRHAGQITTHRCLVCEKPMCPKCMESFGFVCSAYCKGQAEHRGIHVPVFSGQRSVSKSKEFRKLGLIFAGAIALFVLVLGAWAWYAWVGSVPKPAFSLRFPEAAHSGELIMSPEGQAVFLHGGRLVRHSTKDNQEFWSQQLLEKKKIADEAAAIHQRMKAQRDKEIEAGVEVEQPLPTVEELIEGMEKTAAAAMHLHIQGENIWVSLPEKMVRFDWQTGKPGQEIPFPAGYRRLLSKSDEVVVEAGAAAVIRVNLASGEVRSEGIKTLDSATPTALSRANAATSGRTASVRSNDPVRTQNLSTPARAALPAVRAASANQERLVNEMKSGSASAAVSKANLMDSAPVPGQIALTREGAFQVSAKPLGTRSAGRDNAQMYRVVVRRLNGQSDNEWSGDLPGGPEVHSLKTVDVIIAGLQAVVLDKSLKKLWETQLDDPSGGASRPEVIRTDRSPGQGPCAEDGDALYLFNNRMIAAFELATGNSRWKEAHAETTDLFFDGQGSIYANGISTGGDKAAPMVTKIDSKTGKTLWTVNREGAVAFVSGKLVYTLESYVGDRDDADGLLGSNTIFHVPAYLRIRRLDASNGRVLWHHHQGRCPLDIQFEKNQIHLLFRKELQTLKFIVL